MENENKVKVSVIIPVYNVEQYIERCAISLFEQTMEEIEYIFVDDRGKDRSVAVLKDVLERYPQRKSTVKIVVHERNSGSMAARITGLAVARGEYVIYCDSDDWVETDMYETLYNVAKMNNADVVWCDFIDEYKDRSVYRLQQCECNVSELINNILSSRIHGALWNKLVRRDIYIKFDISVLIGINIWEDLYLSVRILLDTKNISYISKGFYHYNLQNQGSLLSSLSLHNMNDRIKICDSLEGLLTEKNVMDIYGNSLKQRQLWAKMEFVTDSKLRDFEKWRLLWPESIEQVEESNFSVFNKNLFKIVSKRLDIVAMAMMYFKDILKRFI